MEGLYAIAVRFAPGLAGVLTGYGVAGNHAEVIALGVVTAVVVVAEMIIKRKRG